MTQSKMRFNSPPFLWPLGFILPHIVLYMLAKDDMLQKLAKRKEKIEIRLPIAMLLLFEKVWKRFFTLFTIVWSKSLPRGPGVMIVIGGAFVFQYS